MGTKIIRLIGFFILFTLSAESLFADDEFRQVGYFKDGTKNRVFTVEMKGNITKSQALAHARSKPSTSGQITAVYFYPPNSVIPADGVTLARNIFSVNSVLYDTKGLSKWRFAYMKSINGSESIIDCEKELESEFCRK